MAYYDATQLIINALASKVKLGVGLINGIQDSLAILNRFKSDLIDLLLKPAWLFMDIVKHLSLILVGLEYLKTIFSVNLQHLPLPNFIISIKIW